MKIEQQNVPTSQGDALTENEIILQQIRKYGEAIQFLQSQKKLTKTQYRQAVMLYHSLTIKEGQLSITL